MIQAPAFESHRKILSARFVMTQCPASMPLCVQNSLPFEMSLAKVPRMHWRQRVPSSYLSFFLKMPFDDAFAGAALPAIGRGPRDDFGIAKQSVAEEHDDQHNNE